MARKRILRFGATEPTGRLAHNATEARLAFENVTRAVAGGRCGDALERYGAGSKMLGRAHAAAEEIHWGDTKASDQLHRAMQASAEAEDVLRASCIRDGKAAETRATVKKQGSLFGVRR